MSAYIYLDATNATFVSESYADVQRAAEKGGFFEVTWVHGSPEVSTTIAINADHVRKITP